MTTNHPTPSEEAAKREGYAKGRNDENYIQRIMRRRNRAATAVYVRENNGAGVLFGLGLATLAVVIGGLLFFSNTSNQEVVPVAVPDVDLPDVQVNVPEVEVPDVEVPDVNITETTSPAAAE